MRAVCLVAFVASAVLPTDSAAFPRSLGLAVDLGLFIPRLKDDQAGLGVGGSIRPFVARWGSSRIGLGLDVTAGQAWLDREGSEGVDQGLGRTLWALGNVRWFMRGKEMAGAAEIGAGPAWFQRKLEGASRDKFLGPTMGGMILARVSGYSKQFGPLGGFVATGFQFFESGVIWVNLLGFSTQWTSR